MTSTETVCASCLGVINGSFIKALGKAFHPEHFKCAHCKKTLATQSFFEKEGIPYCQEDYLDLFCDKCYKCQKPITSDTVKALGRLYHVECFTCSTCNKPIKPPWFYEKHGKPYCGEDFARDHAPKCTACQEPIVDDYLSALSNKWHPNCFLCRNCKKPIKEKKFYVVDHVQMCTACMNKRRKKKGT